MKETPDSSSNSFASLFEKSLAKMDTLKSGQILETEIVSISKEYVFLQLSGKSEGILERAEVTDADGNLTVKEGDTIKVFFLQSRNGELYFTTRIKAESAGSGMLESAYKNSIPVEGSVTKEIKGGYEVRIGDSRAFCPFSQMGLRRKETDETVIGKTLTFKILEYKEGGRNILVSNRAILEEAQQEKKDLLKKDFSEGDVISGTIMSIQDFGAFVDIGGIQALLPISEISRGRVEDIHTVLAEGQQIEAKILSLDWKKDRISISMKALEDDPWESVQNRYPVDSRHTGVVSRIADFGAFVTLESGIDGLIHTSALKGQGKYNSTKDVVKKGETISVQILEVDAERRRISLKPSASVDEEAETRKYIDNASGSEDTYNPFASLLKKK